MTTTKRTVAEIDAEISATSAAYQADEERNRQAIADIAAAKATLEARIRETFASEYAAIAEMERARKAANEAFAPEAAHLWALYAERKHLRMVPGQRVYWDESAGWRGKRSVSAIVMQTTGTRVQIDLGPHAVRRLKWVAFDSVKIQDHNALEVA